MKHTELYFAIQNYMLFALLILLAIGVVAFLIGAVIDKIKSGFDKYMQKKNDEADWSDTDEQNDR